MENVHGGRQYLFGQCNSRCYIKNQSYFKAPVDEGKVQIKWIIPEDDGIDMKIVTVENVKEVLKLKKVYNCITILNMKE